MIRNKRIFIDSELHTFCIENKTGLCVTNWHFLVELFSSGFGDFGCSHILIRYFQGFSIELPEKLTRQTSANFRRTTYLRYCSNSCRALVYHDWIISWSFLWLLSLSRTYLLFGFISGGSNVGEFARLLSSRSSCDTFEDLSSNTSCKIFCMRLLLLKTLTYIHEVVAVYNILVLANSTLVGLLFWK